jgi:hypothetical protein
VGPERKPYQIGPRGRLERPKPNFAGQNDVSKGPEMQISRQIEGIVRRI